MPIIEARGLTRTFKARRREVHAVRGVDLTVDEGEIVGFLGPNGAGKTTTLRMLTTLLRPTAGTAMVAGADLLRDPVGVRRRIGYVPQAIGQTMGGTDNQAKIALLRSLFRGRKARCGPLSYREPGPRGDSRRPSQPDHALLM